MLCLDCLDDLSESEFGNRIYIDMNITRLQPPYVNCIRELGEGTDTTPADDPLEGRSEPTDGGGASATPYPIIVGSNIQKPFIVGEVPLGLKKYISPQSITLGTKDYEVRLQYFNNGIAFLEALGKNPKYAYLYFSSDPNSTEEFSNEHFERWYSVACKELSDSYQSLQIPSFKDPNDFVLDESDFKEFILTSEAVLQEQLEMYQTARGKIRDLQAEIVRLTDDKTTAETKKTELIAALTDRIKRIEQEATERVEAAEKSRAETEKSRETLETQNRELQIANDKLKAQITGKKQRASKMSDFYEEIINPIRKSLRNFSINIEKYEKSDGLKKSYAKNDMVDAGKHLRACIEKLQIRKDEFLNRLTLSEFKAAKGLSIVWRERADLVQWIIDEQSNQICFRPEYAKLAIERIITASIVILDGVEKIESGDYTTNEELEKLYKVTTRNANPQNTMISMNEAVEFISKALEKPTFTHGLMINWNDLKKSIREILAL